MSINQSINEDLTSGSSPEGDVRDVCIVLANKQNLRGRAISQIQIVSAQPAQGENRLPQDRYLQLSIDEHCTMCSVYIINHYKIYNRSLRTNISNKYWI